MADLTNIFKRLRNFYTPERRENMAQGKVIVVVFILLILEVTCVSLFQSSASAKTIDVSADGSATYTKIQEAIDAANQGDTVLVEQGYYAENLLINKTIHLRGETKASTTVDGMDAIAITILSDGVEITDLTITNSSQGIRLENVSEALIKNNTLTKNNIGIYCSNQSADNTIYINNFIENAQHTIDASSNHWYEGKQGNYWDDYQGIDANNDHIGDTPYTLSDGTNTDLYPLMGPVTHPPTVFFDWTPALPSTQNTITFTDASQDDEGIATWQWDFGDGNTSSVQHPEHRYPDNGDYNITLTVTDTLGASTTVIRTISVRNVPPSALWEYTPASPTDLQNVSFWDNSVDSDGHIVAWSWSLSQNTTRTEANASYRFPDNGTYAVTLTVTDDDGATATLTKSIIVRNVAPMARFSYTSDNQTLLTGDTLRFTDTSLDQDGTITAWNWTFSDDGTTSTQKYLTHVFHNSGKHTVTLTVTDNDGAQASYSQTITIASPERKDWMSRFSLSDIVFLVFLGVMIAFVFYVSRRYKA